MVSGITIGVLFLMGSVMGIYLWCNEYAERDEPLEEEQEEVEEEPRAAGHQSQCWRED
jgi:hypothetical protein